MDNAEIEAKINENLSFIKGRVYGRLGRNPDSEDIVSQVLLNLVDALQNDRFRGDSRLQTFIYTIMQRRMDDYFRAKAKTNGFIPEVFYEEPIFKKYYADQEKVNKVLWQCINELPPRQRTAVILMGLAELPTPEVAAKLGNSVSGTCQLYGRAKDNLRRKLPIRIFKQAQPQPTETLRSFLNRFFSAYVELEDRKANRNPARKKEAQRARDLIEIAITRGGYN
jgi:RNA polymerase sigma factor (sigma-70 family)